MPFAHLVWLVLCWGVMVLECLSLIQLVASWGVVFMLACDVVNRPALRDSRGVKLVCTCWLVCLLSVLCSCRSH